MSELLTKPKRRWPRKLIGAVTGATVALTAGFLLLEQQDKGGGVAKPHPTTTSTPYGMGGGEQAPYKQENLSSWVTQNPNVRAAVALALGTTVESITDESERSNPGDQGLTWWSPDKKKELGMTIGDRFLQVGTTRVDQLNQSRMLPGAERVTTLSGAEEAWFSKGLGTLAAVSDAQVGRYISVTLSDRNPNVADGGRIGPTINAEADCNNIASALVPVYFKHG